MRPIVPFLALLLLPLGCAQPAEAPARVEEQSVRPGSNDSFLAEDLDVDDFVARFEGESREIAQARAAIVAACGIEPGMEMADVGAGTGLFLQPFAEAVGEEGRLYSVDLSPGFIEHLRERVADEGLDRVEVVQCTGRSAELPDGSVDLIFICDTYHHFEYPLTTSGSLLAALRPGGRLVVVDFERIPGVSRDWILDHVRASKEEVRAELEEAGFVYEDEVEVEGLDENYLVRFRRP